MIKSNFQLLFSVKVFHTYFENNICNCLQFFPVDATRQLIDKYGFKIRRNVNGFDLFATSSSAVETLFAYIIKSNRQNCFDFDFISSNPYFTKFSDLPSNQLSKITYDSSSERNEQSGGSMELAAQVSGTDHAQYQGGLKIYFADLLKPRKDNICTQFNISFKARATQWQYFIINKSNVQLGYPAVTGKEDIRFTGPEKVTIATGQQALLFSSGERLIPFSEMPVQKFDLLNYPHAVDQPVPQKSSSAKVIFKGLPTPEPGNACTIAGLTGNMLCSPMYVYV